jgi:hypothetical protein
MEYLFDLTTSHTMDQTGELQLYIGRQEGIRFFAKAHQRNLILAWTDLFTHSSPTAHPQLGQNGHTRAYKM